MSSCFSRLKTSRSISLVGAGRAGLSYGPGCARAATVPVRTAVKTSAGITDAFMASGGVANPLPPLRSRDRNHNQGIGRIFYPIGYGHNNFAYRSPKDESRKKTEC